MKYDDMADDRWLSFCRGLWFVVCGLWFVEGGRRLPVQQRVNCYRYATTCGKVGYSDEYSWKNYSVNRSTLTPVIHG